MDWPEFPKGSAGKWLLAGSMSIALFSPVACAGGSSTSEQPPSAPATPSPSPAATPAAGPTRSPVVEVIDLADGRHPAYVVELSVAEREITVDVIQFLTGQEAVEAYQADNPADPEGPPNDYYILNENPMLRTGPLTADAQVRLVKLEQDADADLDDATLEELDEFLDSEGSPTVPFWITVSSGEITRVEEQYIP